MDKVILEALQDYREGEKVALATIVSTRGSTPRGKGAAMLIRADGRTVGTVGGGCAEAEIKQAALLAMDDRQFSLHHVDLSTNLAADEGMVCGGVMDVAIEPVLDLSVFRLLWSYQKQDTKVYSCLIIRSADPAQMGMRAVYDNEGNFVGGTRFLDRLVPDWLSHEPVLVDWEDPAGRKELFIQPVAPPDTLLILGAGYIAQSLVAIAGQLDFEVTVIDDRADFANPAKLPGARVICDSFDRALARYPITGSTYIVIVTRGHRYDAECLRRVVGSPAAYIGMIGSRRRTRLLFEQLEEEGYPREELLKVKTPIGLDIGGETPGEIAVSIMAEVILKRRKGILHL